MNTQNTAQNTQNTVKKSESTAMNTQNTAKESESKPTGAIKVRLKYLYCRKWYEKHVSISKIRDDIANGKYQRRVNAVRNNDTIMTMMGRTDGRSAASELPAFYPSTGDDGRFTGLVLLSVKTPEGQQQLEKLRALVNTWPQTLLSFAGASGMTLKIIIPVVLTDGTLPKDEQQEQLLRHYAFHQAASYLTAATGLKADEVTPDGQEHCRMSSDSKAYLNEHVVPLVLRQPTQPLTDMTTEPLGQPVAQTPLDVDVLPGYTQREMDITKFNFVCRELAFDGHREPDEYLLRLATECRKAGIDQEVATKCILWRGDFAGKDTLVRSCMENAYCNHPLGHQMPIERPLMYQQLIETFLRRRYMFRRNRVTGDLEYQEKDRYLLTWKPLTEEARNDINNAAIREGIKVWPQDLIRILVSNSTPEYDPVREWLDTLPRWDGRDRLGELAARVPTNTPDWQDNFRVWMRSMVSQWTSAATSMYGAQMVLMMVGAQGTRKSTFMRMLLPRELTAFYIDRIDFANKKEALTALSRFLLINIDEYDQISKAQTAYLKHLIQRTDVKQRRMYETTFEQQQRYAAFCATTNALTPLHDESGSRRYMVVELSGVIDTDTQGERQIDYPQLYAQIVHDINSGEPCYFDGERERRIVEYNANFYQTPGVVSMFDDLFRRPMAGDKVLSLSPTEVLQVIKDRLKVNVVNQSNATLIGSHLKREHFKQHYRSYEVALKK